jgi:hypothetical protein
MAGMDHNGRIRAVWRRLSGKYKNHVFVNIFWFSSDIGLSVPQKQFIF